MSKSIAIDERFHPVSDNMAAERLSCLNIPVILSRRHRFMLSMFSSHKNGAIVGADLGRRRGRHVKIFAIYIGGEHPSANMEMSHVRFGVAPSISLNAIPALSNAAFGLEIDNRVT